MLPRTLRLALSLTCLLPLFGSVALGQTRLQERLKSLTKGHPNLSLAVSRIEGSKVQTIFQLQADQPRVPASVMKLVTSWSALDLFGPHKVFETKFFQDGRGVLYVSGEGDPLLTTEKLWIIARKLKVAGIKKVTGVVIHPQLGIVRERENTNPYGAPVSLLGFNFNSRGFWACRGFSGVRVSADPWEYHPQPVNKVTTQAAKLVVRERSDAAGEVVTGGVSRGCAQEYLAVSNPADYFGRTLQGFLGYLGVEAGGAIQFGSKDGGRLLYTHVSDSLSQILRSMNLYSNNIVAEQLVTLLVAQIKPQTDPKLRHRAGLQKSVERLKAVFNFKQGLVLRDGSGLSRENRLTAAVLNDVLGDLLQRPYWIEFLASLPVGGQSGTLKTWQWNPSWGEVRAKTGTLTGVRSLAGVVRGKRCDNLYTFVILQQPSTSSALTIEQKIAKELARAC